MAGGRWTPDQGPAGRTVAGVSAASINTIWVGPEPLRRHLVERSEHARIIDTGAPDAVEAIRTPGLFHPGLHLTGLENAEEARCKAIADATLQSGEPTSGEAEKLTKAQERALERNFTITRLTGRTAAGLIAERLGLTLDKTTERALLDRLEHDPGRLVGVLEALGAGGFRTPTEKQILLLAGSSKEEGMPWHLLDLLEKGQNPQELLETLEAIPTIAFLAKRTLITLYAAENPDHTQAEAAETLGEISDGAWRGAKRLATRIGRSGAAELLERLVVADTWAKRSRPREALVYAAGHTRRVLAGS